MENEKKPIWKAWLFFIFLLLFISVYCLTLPDKLREVDFKNYPVFTQHLGGLWYLLISMGGLFLIQPEKQKKRDWLIACGLGVLSSGITIPVLPTGVINGIATAIAYLSIQDYIGQEGYPLLVHPEKKERIKNIGLIVGCLLIILLLRYITVAKTGNPIKWNFGIDNMIRGLAAGISEELIFRMFLFAVTMKLIGGEPPFAVAVLIMTVPFVMIHAIEPLVYQNITEVIRIIISGSVNTFLLVWLIWKRDGVSAMLIHACWDIVVGMIIV